MRRRAAATSWTVLLVSLAAAALLAAGCASTSNGRPVDEKDAARANMQLGIAYMQQGNLALAKEKLERAEKQDARAYEVQYALALLYERMGMPPEAEKRYQSALRLKPNDPGVTNAYAALLCRVNKVDQSLKLFDGVIRDPLYQTPWIAATNAAICLRTDKRHADAVPYLERALMLRPDYIAAVIELGDVHMSSGKPELARAAVDRFLLIGRKSPDVLLVGVRAALAQGDRAAAEAYARQLRRDFANSPQETALRQLLQPATPR